MGPLLRILFQLIVRLRIFSPVLRPLARLVISLVAIPAFRFVLRYAVEGDKLGRELQKDLEQWFRGAVLLLIATPNMESMLFSWISLDVRTEFNWLAIGLRILLAIGVIEGMPDQALFSIIHPGPSMLLLPRGRRLRGMRENWRKLLWGCAAKHLNRSSPVLAIMCTLFDGTVGWVCYVAAIVQYLIIGLVSSRDAAIDAMEQFDRELALRRAEVLHRILEAQQGAEPAGAERSPSVASTTQQAGSPIH